MHAGLYTDDLLGSDHTRSSSRSHKSLLRGLTSVGRRLVRGRAYVALNDRLLGDIGVSRADIAALTL